MVFYSFIHSSFPPTVDTECEIGFCFRSEKWEAKQIDATARNVRIHVGRGGTWSRSKSNFAEFVSRKIYGNIRIS